MSKTTTREKLTEERKKELKEKEDNLPSIYDRPPLSELTIKQKLFVQNYIETKGNGLQSALAAYNTNKKDHAKAMAWTNLQKPKIKKSIKLLLREAGYDPKESVIRLQKTAKAGTAEQAKAKDQIRADKLLLKLSGSLVDRQEKKTVSVNLEGKSKDELLKLKERYDKIINT